ncbi:hypothetical protein GCM10007092_18890 [Thermus composti]|uniref:NAD-dependent epimerase/dehydratase family protein n=1 Tax=Thermus composti TaxID=532059 RepID=A0ABV6Q055_9DEIN|nr:NAD-dependent epimerase/dehydratase family protein [Thermus composti]GGN04561.1 hypothetical protein GCM10007092_18890 [Thermus composti]
MRILLTGAAGFLGSHLAERLLREGHEVLGVDNLSTGQSRNLERLLAYPGFTFLRADASKPLRVEGPLDWVMHFASPASPPRYLRLPLETLLVNAEGTRHLLDLAREKGAAFFLASTSEVYGDPLVHPQPETYWGNVNPIGPRSIYDEGKRYAEALTVAYHRVYGLSTRIVRIFNSVLADEYLFFFNDGEAHLETAQAYAERLGLAPGVPREVLVPAFDPNTLRVELKRATYFIGHPVQREAYEVRLRYGRTVKVTGDHSLFVRGPDGRPVAKPVRELKPGDYVAVPARLPVLERDLEVLDLAQIFASLDGSPQWLWRWAVRHPSFSHRIEAERERIHEIALSQGRFRGANARNSAVCATKRWMRQGLVPLAVLQALGWEIPDGAEFGLYGDSHLWLPNRVRVTDDLLWLFGLYLAEGGAYGDKRRYFITFSSDDAFIRRAKGILEAHFKVRVRYVPPAPNRAPGIYVHSKALYILFARALGLRKRIPPWVFQLPLSRLKHFLEGYRCGDGTHSGKKLGNELVFDTASEEIAYGLVYLLLRFGIVASVGRYETWVGKKLTATKRYPFYRVTVCALDNFDLLSWDQGVRQKLNARREGDIVWSQVKEVRPCLITATVYDFSVPGAENFVAGNGVFCHNTYGPFMDPEDGRVVSSFIVQALKGEPLTVYGDGSQTRSFCYVDDLIEGVRRLMEVDYPYPVNLGNPEEYTVLELARLVKEITHSPSEIVFKPLPQDDPKQRRPDISLARRLLGWEPRVPVRQGLERTVAHFASLVKR